MKSEAKKLRFDSPSLIISSPIMAVGNRFVSMKNTLSRVGLCVVLAAPLGGLAAPAGGCADLVAPGTWSSSWTYDLCNRSFEMGDGQTYWIRSGAMVRAHPDNAGQWDSIQEYVGAWAQLANAPGTSWHSSSDTNLTFEIELRSLVVKTREAGDPSTNSGRIEMEVAAHAGRLAFLATFVGTPTVTNVPETPETPDFLLASGPLSSARFCFSYDPPTSVGPPLAIHASPVPGPRVSLSWNSVPARLYQLQFCPDLSSGQWEDFEWPVSGTGATLGSVDLMGADIPQRFYRCVAFP
jgi:hypothetical protein